MGLNVVGFDLCNSESTGKHGSAFLLLAQLLALLMFSGSELVYM